jgi:hypothetical protein
MRISPVPQLPPPAPDEINPDGAPESVVQRISRVPTRRVVAYPVVPSVGRKKARSPAWSLAVHVAIALVLACGVALAIVALDSDGSSATRVVPPAVRVGSVHVMDEGFDTLLQTPSAADVATPTAAPSRAHAPSAPSFVHHGRAHHGRRQGRVVHTH